MAGEAKTTGFMLSSATVMLGAQDDLFHLNPDDHSIGLVKNFVVKGEPAYTELTQGVQNTIVHSTMTSNPITASLEVYEYTAKNLNYALGLDGSAVTLETAVTAVNGAIAAPTPPALTTADLIVDSATGITAGDWIYIHYGTDDKIALRKVNSVATNTLTLNVGFTHAIPDNSVVRAVNMVAVGSKENQPFLACVAVGKLASGEWAKVMLPKVRVTKGFEMGFRTDNYGNMPFELQVYDLVSTDPHYAEVSGLGGNSMLALPA